MCGQGCRTVRSERARRPHYLFSGLLTCGACGGGYTLVGARHYGCANVRNRGTCDNRLTIRRDVLEETVLRGLKDNLLQPELIHEFVTTYQQEYNRLRREQANEQAPAHAELARVERQIRNIVEAVKAGLFAPTMKDEMAALEERRARLVELTRDQVEEPPVLHPGLADVYRRKVEKLTEALNKEELRDGGGRDAALDDPDDPARAGGRGAGDRARRRAGRDFGAHQRKKPPAFWAGGSTINAGCGGAQPM